MIEKKRKANKITYLIILMSILVLPSLSLPVVSQTVDAAAAVAAELQARLQLTPEQAAGVVKIFKMAQSQALTDRENFKGNALALIRAAMRRRDMTDGFVEKLLTPEQKPLFVDYKEKRKWTEEFFILDEGLQLSREQSLQVKQILDEYRELLNADRENMAALAEENGGDLLNDPYNTMPGGVGNIPGSITGNTRGNVPNMMRSGVHGGIPGELRGANEESRMLESLKDLDDKKEKKIQKVLTEEQQKMYKDIIKMQQQEMKKRLEERRQG
jgi:hypothetical protein